MFLFSVAAFAQSGPLFSVGRVERTTLDNGMVLLVKQDQSLPLVSIFVCVKSGSAQEGKFSGSGISHFIEHLVFKGTKTRGVGEIFKQVESYGGKLNGFTSYDYTGYQLTVPSEFAGPCLEILADMLNNAAFNEQEMEKERQVVLKEIRLNQDDPQRYLSRLLWKNAYSRHPYKYPILGAESLFKKLTRKDVVKFYQSHYLPNNMILALVGDLQADQAITLVKNNFGNFPQKSLSQHKNKPQTPQRRLKEHTEKFTSGLTYLVLGFHSVALNHQDLFALDVLSAVLGQGESSRLYNLVCSKKELAYNIQAVNYTPAEPGLFIISSFLEDKNRKHLQKLILKQIELIKKKKIRPEELESAKNKIISDILFEQETKTAQAQDLALNEAVTGSFRFTEEYLEKISQVNANDLIRVARRYLKTNNLTVVALTPRGRTEKKASGLKKEALNLSIGVENFKNDALEPIGATAAFNAQVKKITLNNGLRILVQENKTLPVVSIQAVFTGGLRAEEQNTNGLSNLLAKMLDQGTKGRSAGQIAQFIESKGARISAFSGNNSFGLSLQCLSKDLDAILALLAELVIDSSFPSREFNREKEKNLAQLQAQDDDIFAAAEKLIHETLYRQHPYRFLTIGNEQSLKKLKRRDLIKAHRQLCVAKNMVLAVFGDIDTQEILSQAENCFSRLCSGAPAHFSLPQEPRLKTIRKAAEALEKKQSLLLFGFAGTTVFNQDRYALEIISQILSQSSGRLFTQIREKIGIAYALGAYSVLGLDPGYLAIYIATTKENLEKAKQEILRQLTLLKKNALSPEELAQAKRALLSRKLISRQTNAACALESALDELYGLGYNHYLEYEPAIKNIQPEDILRCAQQYFDFNGYAQAVVGPNEN
ncbi:MAG: insulinase family protein [Candidatus Omnitrophica bacterium]|nr:insulinase family protein [Candidatus Omnitrophota bacterium]